MKSFPKLTATLFIAVLLTASCNEKNDTGVICRLKKEIITIRNSNVSLSVDNNIKFAISFKSGRDDRRLTTGPEDGSSVCLIDSSGNLVSFVRKSAVIRDINNISGSGKMITIEAESSDKTILCSISLTALDQFSGVILVESSFKNISGRRYNAGGYILNRLNLIPLTGDNKWWTFQAASYRWGEDFVFRLPDSFKRDNYMGLNAVKAGGGIPLVDLWNKDYGVAVACLSSRPELISLPVKSENGIVNLGVRKSPGDQVLLPGDNLKTVKSAIIVHQNDFYEPLRTYSKLIDPFLPEFRKPAEASYQPEWCTWGYRQDFSADKILNKLDTLKALGIKSVILDDGWSLSHGDWIPDPRKFPGGDGDFKKLIDKLHEKGFKVWIWWVPGYVDSTASIASLNPDWLMKNKDGSVHPSFGFCPAYAPVRQHYNELVRKFVGEYKLDGLKLDFGEINSAPPCYNPLHCHLDPYESYYSTPLLFQDICFTAGKINPDMLLEYCACSIPPNIFHLPFINLAVTSDPEIGQITGRIKMYKALLGDDFPVLEEYCGVLAGPTYQLALGAGGVPGTFSSFLDGYHEKWMNVYDKYQLSKGQYLNLYDFAFDFPEGHAIKKGDDIYYAFYTHPWEQMESGRWFRYGNEFDSKVKEKRYIGFPEVPYSGELELRGLDPAKRYRIINYENHRDLGVITGKKPSVGISFVNYLLLKATPLDPK